MTVEGREVCWQDYFYLYASQAQDQEEQFRMYQTYGLAAGWESPADAEGHSYAELLGEAIRTNLCQIFTVELTAEENGVTLNEEEQSKIQSYHESNIQYFCGDQGSEEELYAVLAEQKLRPEFYQRLLRVNVLAQACFRQIMGSEGELLSEQQVLDWMEDNGVISASHILFATVDLENGNAPLDEAAAAEQAALARQFADELRAIEDPEARQARFQELMEEYGKDGGDLVFGASGIDSGFYEGASALEIGEISEPVKSAYGYHIILRRPLRADDRITGYSGEQDPRPSAASALFSQMMQEKMDSLKVEAVEGFEAPYILDYYTKPSYAS